MSDWIKWEGGECPVNLGTLVDVIHRDGDVIIGNHAGYGYAEEWQFDDHDEDGDIVAWRLHQPPEDSLQ